LSNSFKHAPVCKDRSTSWVKRQASKKVRRTPEIANGAGYKKYFCSWNLHDFRSWCPLEDWWKPTHYDPGKYSPVKMHDWRKSYFRK